MKFCEHMQKAIRLSEPEWTPFFINYSLHKQFCKQLTPRHSDQEAVEGGAKEDSLASERQVLASDKQETMFFKALRAEVQKASELFKIAELLLSERLVCLLNSLTIFQNRDRVPLQDDGMRYCVKLKQACVNFYKEAILLEDFAMINYTAVSKLLKKHDRWSGFRTREKFMVNVMNKEPIAELLYLDEMLREAKDIFAQLEEEESKEGQKHVTDIANAVSGMDEDIKTCIEAILEMKDRSITMQQEEFGPAGCYHEDQI